MAKMGLTFRWCLVVAVSTAAWIPAAQSQQPAPSDRPLPHVPLHPETRQQLAQREACKLFGLAVVRIHQDRLVEAARTLEEAQALDPEAAPIAKALVPLCLALGRSDDAFQMCRKTLELDPGDYETWCILARQLKTREKPKEAENALVRALGCQGLTDHPDVQAQISFDLAGLYEQTHDTERALASFAEVVKILDDPAALPEREGYNRAELQAQAADTYERMIKLCIEDRQYDRALELFARGRKQHPVLATRLDYNLAKLQLAQGRPESALEHLQSYLGSQPHGAEAYELLIAIFRDLRRNDQLLPALRWYAQRDIHNQDLQLLLARECVAARQAEEAEKIYLRLADETPTAEIYRMLFALYRDEGTMERGLDVLNSAVARPPEKGKAAARVDRHSATKARAILVALREDTSLAKSMLPVAQARIVNGQPLPSETLGLMAVLASRAHQLAQAEQFYRRCLTELNSGQQEYAVYVGLIDVLFRARKYEALVDVCRQGLERTQATNHLFFYQYLSQALVNLGKIEEAVAAARKTVDIANEESRRWARVTYIRILVQAERLPEALAQCEAAFKDFKDPGDVRAIRLALSDVYSAMGDSGKSEEQLMLILKSDPNDAGANNNLGYLWADRGKHLEEAERMIRKAITLDAEQARGSSDREENWQYLDSLGWVLFRRGQMQEARAWLEKAGAGMEEEEDPVIWDHLGDVYFRMQENERARSVWQKALALYESGRRKPDERTKELKHKLQLLEVPKQHP